MTQPTTITIVDLDHNAVWSLQEQLDFDAVIDLASGIQNVDGQWELNACPHAAAACLLVLGDGCFDDLRHNKVRWFARLGAYDRIREALEALYPHAHAAVTDPWGYETYVELYKDACGFRPRGEITGAEARAWVQRRDAK